MQINFYIVLVIGVIFMTLTIIKFTRINSNFESPFFTNDLNIFYKNLNIDSNELEKYKKLLKYDSIFPIFYSSVFYSLNKINNNFLIDIMNYTVPIHIILDWTENLLMYLIINRFLNDKNVILNNQYFIISSLKWILAVFNSSTSLYSLGKIIIKNLNKLTNKVKKNKNFK